MFSSKTAVGLLFASTLVAFQAPVALAAAPSPPAGAWIVEKINVPADDNSPLAPGIALVFAPTEVIVVKEGEVRADWTCTASPLDQGDWTFECDHQLVLCLPQAKDGGLQVRTGGIVTTLRPATSGESARLEKVVADSKAASKVLCDRATRCCQEALPLVGGKCGADELPRQRIPRECRRLLTVYAAVLEQAGKAAPPSCSEGR
ncbi:MAG TPA: hypothetical protein VMB50_19785 [Myxococcales bacterium]|nr:hypothetical protein [Myxococcales bacterium]